MKGYISDNGKTYATLEECEKADAAFKRANEEKALKDQARATRAKEVENAFKEAHEAYDKAQAKLEAFCKDYGAFHTSIKNADIFDDFFDRFFSIR